MKRIANIKFYLAGSVSLITFLVYLSSLQNEFVEWDDSLYVFENLHIRALNVIFLKWAFFDFYASNWHPLTWISHALDYSLWGLNPLGHHLTNIILHAVNTFIVVLLVVRLIEAARSMQPSSSEVVEQPSNDSTTQYLNLSPFTLIAATVTGLLFGLHPLHVESVAWVAERKDLLCALFFLLSILAYVRYAANIPQSAKRIEHRTNNIYFAFTQRAMLFALCFFVLALMSKPMAVSLPVVLLILDWYPFKRITSLRTFLNACIEKIPFILLSLASSVLTIMAQRSGEAMALTEIVPIQIRVLVAVRSLIGYLWKMLPPFHLVPYYPYPAEVSFFSPEYLAPLVLAAGITVASFWAAKHQKVWLSVWGYYVVALIPVLGIVQVGGQAMADRYTYLPALGPFLMVGVAAACVWGKKDTMKKGGGGAKIMGAATLCAFVSLSYATLQQIGIWRNTIILWSYVIEKEPESIPLAYNNRGVVLSEKRQFDKAIEDFNKAIALNPSNYEPYSNRGKAYLKMGLLDKALEDCNTALAIKPFHKIYFLRGIVHEQKDQHDRAMEDYEQAIAADPSYVEAYIRLGILFGRNGSFGRAIELFTRAVAINPNYPLSYGNRGFAYFLMERYDEALKDLNRAIELDHAHAGAYVNRGNVYLKKGDGESAVSDFRKACDLGEQKGCRALEGIRPPAAPQGRE